MAYGFKTGGRIAGTLNKRTEAMLEEIASTGETLLQYMLRVMRDTAGRAEMPWPLQQRRTSIANWLKLMPPRSTNKLSLA